MSDEPLLEGMADDATNEPVVDTSASTPDSQASEPVASTDVTPALDQPRGWWAEMPGLNDARDEAEARQRIASLQQGAYRAQQQAQDYAQRLAQSYRPQQPAEPAKPAEPWYKKQWSPPELDRDELARWVVTNPETGQPDFKAGTPQAVQDKYYAWKSYQDKFQTEFAQNPLEWTYNGIKDKLIEDAREAYRQEQAESQHRQFQSQMADEVMYFAQARDALGNPIVVTDAQGVPRSVLTDEGRFYQQQLQAELSQWPQDQWTARLPAAHRAAMREMEVNYYRRQFAQQQPAAPVVDPSQANAEAKANYAKPRGGGHAPSRGGRIAAAADPNTPSPSTSLADIIKADAAAKGIDLATVN